MQADMLAQLYPLCPHCKGDGRCLVRVTPGHSTQSDWCYMRFAAQAIGTYERLKSLEPHFVEYMEKKVSRARWRDGDRYYRKCGVCCGCGHITPENRASIRKWLIWRRDHGFRMLPEYLAALKVSSVEKAPEKH